MLTWMGFVGKLIDLIVNRVAGKRIDLALDEKKKAAKAFVRFHESVADLEQILDSLLVYIETFIEDKNSKIYSVHLEHRVTSNLRRASTEFLDSMKDLGEVLYFYDPKLASLFTKISVLKQGLLKNVYYFFESSVRAEVEGEYFRDDADQELEFTGSESEQSEPRIAKFEPITVYGTAKFCAIKYTIPSDALMNADFEERFAQAVGISREDEWAQNKAIQDLVITIIENNINHGYIGHEDKDKLIELYPKLKDHKELLTKAREGLREFIQNQFSLVDVLYVIE